MAFVKKSIGELAHPASAKYWVCILLIDYSGPLLGPKRLWVALVDSRFDREDELTCIFCAALTFNDILAKKLQEPHNKIDEKDLEKYTPEEYLQYQDNVPTGPEFEGATAVA